MADIVINSRFQPYNYQDMLQPVQQATQAHQDVENNLSELATKSNVWEEMANKETDPYAYNLYKNYSNDLQNKASQLATQGLTPKVRQDMLGMKQRYAKEIIPIEQAYTKRSQLVDEQRKLQDTDNTMMFDKPASMMSLKELIKNPNVTPVAQSGASIEKRASDAFTHFAKELKDNPNKYSHVMNGQYWEKVQQNGYKAEDIRKAIMNDPNSSWALTEMRGQLLDSVPKQILANPENEQKILNHINIGMASAIGTGDIKTAQDTDHGEYLKEKLFQARQKNPPVDNTIAYESIPHTTVDGKVKTTDIQDDANFLKQIQANPNLLNEKKVTYQKGSTSMRYGEKSDDRTIESYPYKDKFESISKKYNIPLNTRSIDGETTSSNLMLASKLLENELKKSAVRDFDHKLNTTSGETMSQTILENAGVLNSGKSGRTGVYNFENGEKGEDQLGINDVVDKLEDAKSTLFYTPGQHGFKVTSYKKGKSNTLFIDPEVIDTPNREYSRLMKAIDNSIKSDPDKPLQVEGFPKPFQNTASAINYMLSTAQGQFNSKAQVQSKTAKQQ